MGTHSLCRSKLRPPSLAVWIFRWYVALLLATFAAAGLAPGSMAGNVLRSGTTEAECSTTGDDSSLLLVNTRGSVRSQNDSDDSSEQMPQPEGRATCHPAVNDSSDTRWTCHSNANCAAAHPLETMHQWKKPEATATSPGRTCKVNCHHDKTGYCFFGGYSNNSLCSPLGCTRLCITPPNARMCITGYCFKAGEAKNEGVACQTWDCQLDDFCSNGEVCFSPAEFHCYKLIRHFLIRWKYCSDCRALS